MEINYLDLFSGIGGFALGIQQSGIKFGKHYFSEIDKYATQIYKQHFPDAIELGDIKTIRPETLGKIDLITFGFPCQDLSIAGKRAGLGGARSGLFFEAMRIIRELRPPVFIFENVKGLLTSNEGKDFEVVLREVADIGLYECEWQLVNTSWVLPQNRERIYFIGHLGEGSGQKVFPIGEEYQGSNKKSQIRIYSNTLTTANTTGILEAGAIIIRNSKGFRRGTLQECEQLQGFPKNWTGGIKDRARSFALGNAVSVPIVKMIIERLYITPGG